MCLSLCGNIAQYRHDDTVVVSDYKGIYSRFMGETPEKIEAPTQKSRIEPELSDSVGGRLQALRKKFGLSQRELARRADVTNSTLSMIEQGKVSPSVGSLEKILHAFPISLQEFFSETLALSPAVISADEFIHITRGHSECRIFPLALGNERSGAYLAEQSYPPGARIDSKWMAHDGFIGGIVISGCLDLYLDGVQHLLTKGDGFNFSLHRDHVFHNSGVDACKIVCVSVSE